MHNKDILYNLTIHSEMLWCVNIIPTLLNHIFFVCVHTLITSPWGTSMVCNSSACVLRGMSFFSAKSFLNGIMSAQLRTPPLNITEHYRIEGIKGRPLIFFPIMSIDSSLSTANVKFSSQTHYLIIIIIFIVIKNIQNFFLYLKTQ